MTGYHDNYAVKVSNESKSYCENPLNKSGYQTPLQYNKLYLSTNNSNKNRERKIICFNPPRNQSVSTNVAKISSNLIDKNFH